LALRLAHRWQLPKQDDRLTVAPSAPETSGAFVFTFSCTATMAAVLILAKSPRAE
jgi:hypothetical protein